MGQEIRRILYQSCMATGPSITSRKVFLCAENSLYDRHFIPFFLEELKMEKKNQHCMS